MEYLRDDTPESLGGPSPLVGGYVDDSAPARPMAVGGYLDDLVSSPDPEPGAPAAPSTPPATGTAVVVPPAPAEAPPADGEEDTPRSRAVAFLRELAPDDASAQRRAVTTLLRALLADRGIR